MLPATYTLLALVMSICGILGSDTQAFITAVAVRCIDLQDGVPTGRACAAAEGPKMAQLRRCFSFVLQQVLSQRIRH